MIRSAENLVLNVPPPGIDRGWIASLFSVSGARVPGKNNYPVMFFFSSGFSVVKMVSCAEQAPFHALSRSLNLS